MLLLLLLWYGMVYGSVRETRKWTVGTILVFDVKSLASSRPPLALTVTHGSSQSISEKIHLLTIFETEICEHNSNPQKHNQMNRSITCMLSILGLCSYAMAELVDMPLAAMRSLKGYHSTDQDLQVLGLEEQVGAKNDWDTYIELSAEDKGYSGIFDYTVPSSVKITDIKSIVVQVNYLGTSIDWAEWKWEAFDFITKRWTFLGNNKGADWSTWHKFQFELTETATNYISTKDVIRLRLRTSKAHEVCDLDVQRVLVDALSPTVGNVWRPSPGTTWQWQISGAVDTSFDVQMYDIDLFDSPQSAIDQLHEAGRIVICYFSAGSFEDWRSDASDFQSSMLGKPLGDWEGEWWLDIRQINSGVGPIMEARMDLAVLKKCDGVEPDNIDGYQNDNGLGLSALDQLTYNRWLAAQAHLRGLSIGLKNDLDQVLDLVDDFDWALNEQCWEYDECDMLLPFIEADKAVFGVEYTGSPDSFCPQLNSMGFSWLKKTYDLDAWRQDCRFY